MTQIIHQQADQAKQKKYWRFNIKFATSETQFYRNVETFSVGPSGVLTMTDPNTKREIMAGPATPWTAQEQEEFISREY